MEITAMTFISLFILLVSIIYFIYKLFTAIGEHDKMEYSTLNRPLKNSNKFWYK